MRTPLVIAGFGAIVVALAAGVSPGKAQSATQVYPYCAFRAGSTSCYFMTLETCGRSCIANPGYVGEERARALRAALGIAAPADDRPRASAKTGRRLANNIRNPARAAKSTATTARSPAVPRARASFGASD
jgi:hypothetical protein